MYTPVNPSITVYKWGVREYTLHGLVFMMHLCGQIVTSGTVGSSFYSFGRYCPTHLRTCFTLQCCWRSQHNRRDHNRSWLDGHSKSCYKLSADGETIVFWTNLESDIGSQIKCLSEFAILQMNYVESNAYNTSTTSRIANTSMDEDSNIL